MPMVCVCVGSGRLYQKAQYERLQAKETSEKAEKEQRREVAKKEKEDLYSQRVKELEAKRRSNRCALARFLRSGATHVA
jgi:hypothetical protein